MSSRGRAILLGSIVGLVLIGGLAWAVVGGYIAVPQAAPSTQRLLVIGTASDGNAEAAPLAFVIDSEGGRPRVLDTQAQVFVSGTSARTPRDAYTYAGGSGVARALAEQTGARTLPWVVLKPDVWASYIDREGGVTVDVPQSISVYDGSKLTTVEEGKQRLSGSEAVALAAALSYFEDDKVRSDVTKQLAEAVAEIIAKDPSLLSDSVDAGQATLGPGQKGLEGF